VHPPSFIRSGRDAQRLLVKWDFSPVTIEIQRDRFFPRFMNAFEANATELEKLRQRVDETFRQRSESPENRAAWQEAARAFHAAYDKLAFPGGLNREFELFPRMPGPLPRRSHGVHIPVSSSVSSAFPQRGLGQLPASLREYDFSGGVFSRLQTFLYVQASEFARLRGRSYRCTTCRRAAETFTSGQNVLRCLCTHRIC